ncbi:hypothetical protein Ocin01_18069 [Orchesella cincta]|uniref:Uncharacterized protein n=1 Tax=Orchesella cincta TaxID=48709 RepID=A0A1D2M6L8_ORCCI|nr:hypothetical protein Ocin01_18069 [Orchesella cincta]
MLSIGKASEDEPELPVSPSPDDHVQEAQNSEFEVDHIKVEVEDPVSPTNDHDTEEDAEIFWTFVLIQFHNQTLLLWNLILLQASVVAFHPSDLVIP